MHEGAQRVEHAPDRNTQAVGHLGRCESVPTPARQHGSYLRLAHLCLAELDPVAPAEDGTLAEHVRSAEVADAVAEGDRDSSRDELLATGQHRPSVGSWPAVPRCGLRWRSAMVEQFERAGIGVEVDPIEYPNGVFARLEDPEGNPPQLWEPREGVRPS